MRAMTIVYEKLMGLEVPPAEQSYGVKDCILYALGIGLGHDPMNENELAFVYEKNLKVLPTMGTVLGHPGFWARERDTGIDWLKIVNGEQGITLHPRDEGVSILVLRAPFVPVGGRILEASTSGMKLGMPQILEPGTLLQIRSQHRFVFWPKYATVCSMQTSVM